MPDFTLNKPKTQKCHRYKIKKERQRGREKEKERKKKRGRKEGREGKKMKTTFFSERTKRGQHYMTENS
jgi:hypothetical protein